MNDAADSTPVEATTPPPATTPKRSGWVRRVIGWIWRAIFGVVVLVLLLWATAAVYFADTHAGPRTTRATLFALLSAAALLFLRPRRRGLAVFALLFLVVLGWFFSIQPRSDRDWAIEVTRLPWATVDGDRVVVHDVRNFEYRSETDFTPRWDDRTYDLSTLRATDLMLVYWGSPAIAHAMVSFVFDDGQCLAVSIETRKEMPESYSALQGFFRQYELIFVFADERDVVRLRTEFRNEDVYLYHTNLTPAQSRQILVSYLAAANSLKERPEFYNALTTNCATSVVTRVQNAGVSAKLTWETLLSGYAARQAYANGRLDTRLPYEELQRRSYVNPAARAAGNDSEFSRLIRVGLPKPAVPATGASSTTAPAATGPAH